MGQSSGIGVLDKAMSVLVAVASEPGSLADLVERTGLPRATAHRLAVALEIHRLLVRDDSGRWSPGPALSELARGAPDTLLATATPVLVRLRDETGESTQLYRRDRDVRICVAAEERAHGLRDTVPVGARLPMTAGSAAQVLIAWADPADAANLLTHARFTTRTVAEVRRRGWAYSVGEREDGVASVSAPIFDHGGGLVAAISVSGPIGRLGRRPGQRLSPAVVAAGRALSRRL
ncbi:MAG: IclR family transcriptional regulator [Actinobacteria bacterium]|nr:IclR family transcriptional regulator [Actinomycetota bacterium]